MSILDGTEGILYPLENFNFMLRVEGVFDLPCKSVHSFNREREYDYIQEGGLNDYVHMKRKPITKPFTFTVERYVAVDTIPIDPLQEGTELVLPVLLFVSRFPGRFDTTRRVYTFTGCTVISKEYGELNAEHPGLLVEKAVIAYRELVTVTTFEDKDVGMWSIKDPEQQRKARKDFSRDFERDDNGNINDKRVGLWKFEKEEPQGSGKRSAKIIDNGSNSNPTEALRWDIKNPEENRRADKDFSRDYRKDENGNIDDERVGRWTLNPGNPQGTGKKSARIYQKPADKAGNGTDYARKWEYGQDENSGKKSVRSALTKELVEEMQRKNNGGR